MFATEQRSIALCIHSHCVTYNKPAIKDVLFLMVSYKCYYAKHV